MNFDGLLYIMCFPMFIVSLLLMIINVVFYFLEQMTLGLMLLNIAKLLIMGYVLLVLVALVTLIIEKRSIKKMAKGIIMFPIFMFSWTIVNFVCIFKRDGKWEKIEHNKNITIDELK